MAGDPRPPTDTDSRKRGQNMAILLALLGFCALLFAITIVKMAHL